MLLSPQPSPEPSTSLPGHNGRLASPPNGCMSAPRSDRGLPALDMNGRCWPSLRALPPLPTYCASLPPTLRVALAGAAAPIADATPVSAPAEHLLPTHGPLRPTGTLGKAGAFLASAIGRKATAGPSCLMSTSLPSCMTSLGTTGRNGLPYNSPFLLTPHTPAVPSAALARPLRNTC